MNNSGGALLDLAEFRHVIAQPLCEVVDFGALKPVEFFDIDADTTVREAARQLLASRISALLIRQQGAEGLGIFTEANVRQISRARWDELVGDVMSRKVETIAENEPFRMVLKRFQVDGKRHLPVMVNGELRFLLRPRSIVRTVLRWGFLRDAGFFQTPAIQLVSRTERIRRDRLRVSPEATLGETMEIMRELHGSAVRIPESGPTESILTDRDIVKAASRDLGPETRIGELATENPRRLPADCSIETVARFMTDFDIRHGLIDSDGYGDEGDGQHSGGTIVVPRDIIQAVAEIDYAAVTAGTPLKAAKQP